MLSTIIIALGIVSIIMANSYKEDITQVITMVSFGIAIISITIINYIFYIKKNLKDFNENIREENKKRTMKIGEIIELVFFIIFSLTPIWRIPKFIEIFDNRNLLIIEIIKSFILSISALILLFELNLLDFKGRLKHMKLSKKTHKK